MHPSVHVRTQPDKPAVIMAATGEIVTYRQLEDRSNQIAQLFRKLGLGRGDSIAIWMENNRSYLEICIAAGRAGLYYTAIGTRLTMAEVAYIAGDCGARVLITSHAMAEQAAQLRPMLTGADRCFMIGGTAPGYESFDAAVAEEPAVPIADQMHGRDMLYSSGTTGRPKGVRQELSTEPIEVPHPTLFLLVRLYRFDTQTIYLSPAPLYHAAPLRYSLGALALGGTVVIMDHFEPETALSLIERHRITHSQWVPTMFVRMLKLPPDTRTRYDLSSLKVAIHAAAPCPIEVKQQMIDWWGPIVYEYYAATEGNGFCGISSAEWLSHRGSVGRAMLGEPHILDESGNELPVGQEGIVYFANGPQFSYHNDPVKTAESRSSAGWTTMGDIGRLDAEGYLYLTDRKSFVIISGGVNIYPQEAENALILHPKVADVAVIGVPDPEFGESVKAIVQPVDMAEAGPELEAELIQFCKQRLSAIKCPRSIDFDPALPRYPNGKLYKRLIKDRYWAGHASRIL
jgi:acyl-CoA synthetase (AMP-forming)/AMP-acid ligase II